MPGVVADYAAGKKINNSRTEALLERDRQALRILEERNEEIGIIFKLLNFSDNSQQKQPFESAKRDLGEVFNQLRNKTRKLDDPEVNADALQDMLNEYSYDHWSPERRYDALLVGVQSKLEKLISQSSPGTITDQQSALINKAIDQIKPVQQYFEAQQSQYNFDAKDTADLLIEIQKKIDEKKQKHQAAPKSIGPAALSTEESTRRAESLREMDRGVLKMIEAAEEPIKREISLVKASTDKDVQHFALQVSDTFWRIKDQLVRKSGQVTDNVTKERSAPTPQTSLIAYQQDAENPSGHYSVALNSLVHQLERVPSGKLLSGNTNPLDLAHFATILDTLKPVQAYYDEQQKQYQFDAQDVARVQSKLQTDIDEQERARSQPPTIERLKEFSEKYSDKIARLAQLTRKAVAQGDALSAMPDKPAFSANNKAELTKMADTMDTMNRAITALVQGVPLTDTQAQSLQMYHFVERTHFNDRIEPDNILSEDKPGAPPRASTEMKMVSKISKNPSTRSEQEQRLGPDLFAGPGLALQWAQYSRSTEPSVRSLITELTNAIPLVEEVSRGFHEYNISPDSLKQLVLENRKSGPLAAAPVVTPPNTSRIITPEGMGGDRLVKLASELSPAERAAFLPNGMDAAASPSDWAAIAAKPRGLRTR